MGVDSEHVIEAAMDLPLEARGRLIRQLILSLEPSEAESDGEAHWLREIGARLEQVQGGAYESQDWQESVEWLRSEFKTIS